MKSISILCVTLSFLVLSCATLDKSAITSLQKNAFKPLTVKPGLEPFQERVDIIRQTNSTVDGNGNMSSSEESYHPAGFDLGNGLFYDFNNNLSLRVDDLIPIEEDKNYVVSVSEGDQLQRRRSYKLEENKIYKMRPGKDDKFLFEIKETANGFRKLNKNENEAYTFKSQDDVWQYKNGISSSKKYFQTGEYEFTLRKPDGKNKISMRNDTVFLSRDYIVARINEGKILKIMQNKNAHCKDLFTIIKSNDQLYIFDKEYRGYSINRNHNVLAVQKNKSPQIAYTYIQNEK